MTHPDAGILHDHMDGRLDPADERGVVDHLATCAQCRDEVRVLRELVTRAANLDSSLPIPEGLWRDVRATIGTRQVKRLNASSAQRWSPRMLVAAAAVLVVVSSGTTAYLMRGTTVGPAPDPGSSVAQARLGIDPGVVRPGLDPGPSVVQSRPGLDPGPSASGAAVLPASWQATEAGYLESVASLRAQLDAQRDVLDSATVAVVERSLATIDGAIAEARAALLRDPANAAVSDLLASNYRQKVELLRRATQLASTT